MSESNQRMHSNVTADCHHCGHHLAATVNLQKDPVQGGLNVVDVQPPQGGSYIHGPYFANKVEGVDEGGTPTGRPT